MLCRTWLAAGRASKFYSEAEKLDAEREEEAAALELEGLDGDNDSRLLNKVRQGPACGSVHASLPVVGRVVCHM